MKRSQMREIAFKFLYGAEIQKELDQNQVEDFLESNEIEDENAKAYLLDIVNGIKENNFPITKLIEENLRANWQIERISKVSLALLKIAIYEIQYQHLPYKAIINEVVELAKKYGDENAKQFINGVLASIISKMRE